MVTEGQQTARRGRKSRYSSFTSQDKECKSKPEDSILDDVGEDFTFSSNGGNQSATDINQSATDIKLNGRDNHKIHTKSNQRFKESSPSIMQKLDQKDFDDLGDNSDSVLDHEPETNSDIEFNVDDEELADLDTKCDTSQTEDKVKIEVKSDKHVEIKPLNILDVKPATSTKIQFETSSKTISTGKKSKRKFGLEYIVVCLVDSSTGVSARSMKESPHECVLCLPGQSFNATMLAKHINSCQHLINVMETHDHLLYLRLKDMMDATQLHSALCEAIAEPIAPMKLLVVVDSKLEDTREKLLEGINRRKRSVKQTEVSYIKRFLDSDSGVEEPSTSKKIKMDIDDSPPCLLVGDTRAQYLCEANKELADSCSLEVYAGAKLDKILSGAITKLQPHHKVLVIVSLLNDFVSENVKSNSLFMVNPKMADIANALNQFATNVKIINPLLKVIITVPTYIDFIEYSKRLKRLSLTDFERLENFSSQVMASFKQLHEGLRYMSKNVFSFNFNITLRDPSMKGHSDISRSGKPVPAANRMHLLRGTLVDGFRLSSMANKMIAGEINDRIRKLAENVDPVEVKPNKVIDCWTACRKILIIGDHQTFKFETASPADMVKNVTLVSEKFAAMKTLLEKADEMLDESVDLLIIVGFYREFAQNVINGRYTILEPKVPNKEELFSLLDSYKNKWSRRYERLTLIFTMPQLVDFYKYNTVNNIDIHKSTDFTNDMNRFSHQFSVNIMSFYKELRPFLTLRGRNVWLYHMTNALFENHRSLMKTLGNFSVRPEFPPNSTFDGFKPNQATSLRMRADLLTYVTKIFRKSPVAHYKP